MTVVAWVWFLRALLVMMLHTLAMNVYFSVNSLVVKLHCIICIVSMVTLISM